MLAARDDGVTEDRRIRFRIGINVGDIIVDDGDVYGDGVNLAARLEALADAGGISISGSVFEQVRNKVDLTFDDCGEQQAKNIATPVHVYAARMPVDTGPPAAPAAPVVAMDLPDKPSIAVLPFDNMSGDSEQDFLADGITEDIITALSKIRWFFVIARNSTFTYKGRAIDVTEVARELGVRYVIEGSVRTGGKRVRVTAQLIDATNGRHVWAERYDRDLADIFALQDEMTETIVRAIEPELSVAERDRAIRKPPGNFDAWTLLQRGLWHHYRFTKKDNDEAKVYFRRAIDADPNFSQALAALAHAYYWDALFGFSDDLEGALSEAAGIARMAVSLDDKEPFAHFSLGRVQALRGAFDPAIAELEQAIDLNPNFAHAYYGLGFALILAGRHEAGLGHIETAIRLNPHDPAQWTYLGGRALGLMQLRRLDEALESCRRSAQQANAGMWSHAILAAILAHLGRAEEARAALGDALAIKHDLTVGFARAAIPFQQSRDLNYFHDGLRSAGLPE